MSAETDKRSVDERLIRRLIWWNRLWLTLILGTAAVIVPYTMLLRAMNKAKEMQTQWVGQDLRISSLRGGKIITHLTAYPSQGGSIVAQLPSPIYLIDSEGASFTAADMKKLTWKGGNAIKVPAPSPGTTIYAVYYNPEYSGWIPSSP